MYMGKYQLLTTAISLYRTSVENVELSSPVQHNVSPEDNFRTTLTVSVRDVTGMKPCSNFSPNQLVLRIALGTETTLIRKEDTAPLIICLIFVLLTLLETLPKVANFQRDAEFSTGGE
ncbi:uncharacterized protein TNCV_3935941 [Trichonephila clavipes]|nr:uncharacterized protein TNCV_3935941 [Trichonephila clavipes]